MYQKGHKLKRRYWPYGAALVLAALVVAAVLGSRQFFQADTKLTQSPPHFGTVQATNMPLQHVTKPGFTLDLPAGWQSTAAPNVAYTVYSWQGTRVDNARRLDVYWDKIPASLAVNRLLPLSNSGAGASIAGPVSDNCTAFTDKAASPATGTVPAKWNGVNFICDTGNYERDVVGTGSSEGVNTVTVVGPTTGRHHVMFVYTDNSATPDYTLLENIIRSFRAL